MIGCGLAALSAWGPVAAAAESPVVVEGLRFERQMTLAQIPLVLNGTGVRGIAWFKGFVGALYLGRRVTTSAEVAAQPGPKRLQLRMLVEVPAAEFAKAFRKGVTRNTPSPAELASLQDRMASFESVVNALGRVRKGDVIDLDLDPQRGTLFSVNGTLRAPPLAGEDFYAALLRTFIGEQPYDDKLKAGLLGQKQ